MGDLGLNKIFGALLAVVLAVLGLRELSGMVFHGSGGGHHGEEYETLNDWAASSFAYRVDIAEVGGAGAAAVEEIYDLGLLLANASVSAGERSFKSKCASCHSIEQGGVNGTGPNLYDTVGASKQHIAGFNYSGALSATDGNWSFENLDAWLENPSKYARGTSMAFAGLKRDDERANVLAYLASYTPDAPAFPEPLPTEEAVAEGETVDDESAELGEALDENPTEATGVIETQDAALGEETELVSEDTAEAIEETTLEGEGNDVVEDIADPALDEE